MSVLDDLLIACSTRCQVEALPGYQDPCGNDTWSGRVSETLHVPCTEQIDEAWIQDLSNWQRLFVGTDPTIALGRRSGKGIGSYTQANATAIDTGANCGLATLVGGNMTWELTFIKRIFDRTAQLATHDFANKLHAGAMNQYKMFARFCDNPDMILPIGMAALSKLNNTLPESIDDQMTIEYGFQWRERGIPTPILVPGLGAVLE